MVEVEILTDIGGREENQDRAAYFRDEELNETLIVVADGMGGHRGGSLAAETIIETAKTAWAKRKQSSDIESFLNTMVMDAHKAINTVGKEKDLDPHSTLVALYLTAEQAISIHVGDSRIIQFNDQGYVKRSIDHSIAQLFVLQGKITEEEMASHPDQNKLTTSMGGEDEPDPEITHWALNEGLKFILCSDGFWEIVNIETMSSILNSENLIESLQNRTRDALRLAPDDHDNTTVAAVKINNKTTSKQNTKFYITAIIILCVLSIFWLNSREKPRSHPIDINKPTTTPKSENKVTIKENDKLIEKADLLSPHHQIVNALKDKENNEESSNDGEGDNKSSELELGKQNKVNQDTQITIKNSSETAKKVSEHLRKDGLIGKDDKLQTTGNPIVILGKRIIQHQQKYKGIPVLGAVITTIEENGKIITLHGKTSPNINISITPKLSYKHVIKTINNTTKSKDKLTSMDKGTLVIIQLKKQYVLAWMGNIQSKEPATETFIINSNTAGIILRLPLIINKK